MVILFMLEKNFPPLARVVTVTFFVIPDKNGFSFIILVFVLFFFFVVLLFVLLLSLLLLHLLIFFLSLPFLPYYWKVYAPNSSLNGYLFLNFHILLNKTKYIRVFTLFLDNSKTLVFRV